MVLLSAVSCLTDSFRAFLANTYPKPNSRQADKDNKQYKWEIHKTNKHIQFKKKVVMPKALLNNSTFYNLQNINIIVFLSVLKPHFVSHAECCFNRKAGENFFQLNKLKISRKALNILSCRLYNGKPSCGLVAHWEFHMVPITRISLQMELVTVDSNIYPTAVAWQSAVLMMLLSIMLPWFEVSASVACNVQWAL